MRKFFTTLFATISFLGFFQNVSAQKVGLFIGYESVSQIEDDDEMVAAQWFESNYPDGVIVTPTKLSEISDLSTLWIPIDRVGDFCWLEKSTSGLLFFRSH